jgi:hypothetical protein
MICPNCNKSVMHTCTHDIGKYTVLYEDDWTTTTYVQQHVSSTRSKIVLRLDGLVLLDSEDKIEKLRLLL